MFNCDKTVVFSLSCAIALGSILLFTKPGEAATIYIWRDDNGVRQYADYCPPEENCRVRTVGERRASKLLGNTSTTTTDTSSTGTSTTDTSTTTSSSGNTTDSTSTSGDTGSGGTTASTEPTTTEPATGSGDTASTGTTDPASTDPQPVALGDAILEWDPVADDRLSGYRVFYALAGAEYQAVDVGDTTSYTMAGLESGKRYYFRVAAYDSSGNQGDFSNEVYKDMP